MSTTKDKVAEEDEEIEVGTLEVGLTPKLLFKYAIKLIRDAIVPLFFIYFIKKYEVWEYITTQWQYSELLLIVLLSIAVHDSIYVLQNSIYTIVDHFNLLPSRKIYRNDRVPKATKQLVIQTLKEALGTHFIGQPLAFFALFPLFKYFGLQTFVPIPPMMTLFWELIVVSIITDAVHYFLHRSAHLPQFYRFHKQHHEYKRTIGIASEYSSLVESLTVNFIPVILGPLLVADHFIVWLAWVALRTYESTEAHTGSSLFLLLLLLLLLMLMIVICIVIN